MKLPKIKYIIPYSYCCECREIMHKDNLRWRRRWPWDEIFSSNRYCKWCSGKDIASIYRQIKLERAHFELMREALRPFNP